MTVGMVGADLLCKCIDKQFQGAGSSKRQQQAALTSLPRDFHTQLGAMIDFPWVVSSGPDMQYAYLCSAKLPSKITQLFSMSLSPMLCAERWMSAYS